MEAIINVRKITRNIVGILCLSALTTDKQDGLVSANIIQNNANSLADGGLFETLELDEDEVEEIPLKILTNQEKIYRDVEYV